ncbi:fluoride efflux transporter CrcB [Halobacillus litoralis]|uniref:fluoride efflux transporter CrcB n=1 Tax=Halobacillus litoralis TaxID=45668 RepID=UPI001CFDCB15|nr:fluoride efflux transporter CrcB [Halobacillus litoralis]
MSHLLLVGIGGFVGAIFRYSLAGWVNKQKNTSFPMGTMVVNLFGSFLLGILIGIGPGSLWISLAGTGILGAFTTFSTFKLEAIQLHLKRKWKMFLYYLIISYTIGLLFAFTGYNIGQWIQF